MSRGHSSTSGGHAVLLRMKAHGRDAEGLLGGGALLSEHPGRGRGGGQAGRQQHPPEWASAVAMVEGCAHVRVCVFPGSLGADHITVLETEIRNLKHKFKALEEQLEDVFDPSKTSSSYADFQPSVHASARVPGKSPCPVLSRALPQ